MTDRLENAIDILATAYLNDELKAGDCSACAVGNLLGGTARWKSLFYTEPTDYGYSEFQKIHTFRSLWNDSDALIQTCYATGRVNIKGVLEKANDIGYSLEELAEVEHAFETMYWQSADNSALLQEGSFDADFDLIDEAQFKALMAVVDVLIGFEELPDQEHVRKTAKRAFVRS